MTHPVNNKYFIACSTGNVDAVRSFLDAGVEPDARDRYELTGLMWAGRKGRVAVAQLLLERGACIEAGDVRDRTALFHAVTYQRYDFVTYLASVGANVSPVDSYGWTPLDFSVTSHNRKMVTLPEGLGATSGRRA